MCKEIVRSPELCGKLTFPVSLKQPGPQDGIMQCFIKRDKSNLTYHLFLCLSPGDTELLKHLLSRGINHDLESDARTPLVWAAGHGQQDVVSVLLEHGANVCLHLFCYFVLLFNNIVGWMI